MEGAGSDVCIFFFTKERTLSLGMVKNHSLLMDLEEALLLPLNLWNALVTYTGRAAIFIALTGTVVLGIAGIEILKAVKKTWSHLYLFYLILSMAITTAMGDLIKSYIPLNQVLTWMLLFLLLWLINRQISHRIGIAAAISLKYFGCSQVVICDYSDFRLDICKQIGFEVYNNKDDVALDDLSRVIERASDVEHALNVVIGFE